MISTICGYGNELVMGAAALIGALSYAGYSIYKSKKELGSKFVFSWAQITDTIWQSTAAGLLAGLGIGCSWVGIASAMIAGIGADRIGNKTEILNVVQLIASRFDKD